MSSKYQDSDDEDNDNNDGSEFFNISESKDAPVSPLSKRMGLDLSSARRGEEFKSNGPNIQESEVMIIFDLPDGSQSEHQFKLGNTVEYLKSYIEDDFGIPMSNQELFIDDRKMMNPLSLLDFPEAKGVDEVFIRVEGQLPSYSKK